VGFAEANENRGGAPSARCTQARWCAGIPKTARKSLYLSSHASHIVGWRSRKGSTFCMSLFDRATQPQFVYTHRVAAVRYRHVGQPRHDASRASPFRRRPIHAICGARLGARRKPTRSPILRPLAQAFELRDTLFPRGQNVSVRSKAPQGRLCERVGFVEHRDAPHIAWIGLRRMATRADAS